MGFWGVYDGKILGIFGELGEIMKLYQIEHINEDYNKNRVMGMELKFKYAVCSTTGGICDAEKQPDDWDHVKRLTHMLFLAWNDENPIEGVVYLGDLVSEKSNKERFCDFFNTFNGFPINHIQKALFDNVNLKYNMGTRGRRSGVSTFLMTLVAWEAVRGKKVMWAHTNRELLSRFRVEYNNKCEKMKIYPTPVDYLIPHDGNRSNLCGTSCDIALYDCSGHNWQLDWWEDAEQRSKEYSIAIRTIEYDN